MQRQQQPKEALNLVFDQIGKKNTQYSEALKANFAGAGSWDLTKALEMRDRHTYMRITAGHLKNVGKANEEFTKGGTSKDAKLRSAANNTSKFADYVYISGVDKDYFIWAITEVWNQYKNLQPGSRPAGFTAYGLNDVSFPQIIQALQQGSFDVPIRLVGQWEQKIRPVLGLNGFGLFYLHNNVDLNNRLLEKLKSDYAYQQGPEWMATNRPQLYAFYQEEIRRASSSADLPPATNISIGELKTFSQYYKRPYKDVSTLDERGKPQSRQIVYIIDDQGIVTTTENIKKSAVNLPKRIRDILTTIQKEKRFIIPGRITGYAYGQIDITGLAGGKKSAPHLYERIAERKAATKADSKIYLPAHRFTYAGITTDVPESTVFVKAVVTEKLSDEERNKPENRERKTKQVEGSKEDVELYADKLGLSVNDRRALMEAVNARWETASKITQKEKQYTGFFVPPTFGFSRPTQQQQFQAPQQPQGQEQPQGPPLFRGQEAVL